jgi:hypothetical protein
MPVRTYLLLATVSTFVFLTAFHLRLFPLGIPGELEIARLTEWDVPPSVFPELLLPIGAAVLLASTVAFSLSRISRTEHTEYGRGQLTFIVPLTCCLFAGAAFQLSLEMTVPHGLQRWAVLHHGFRHAARVKFESVSDVADNHATVIAEMLPSHFTANPAGWVIVYRCLLDYFDEHRDTALAVLEFQPSEMGWQLRQMIGTRGVPASDQAAMTIVAIISRIIGLSVGIPVACLAWMRCCRQAAIVCSAAANMLPTMALLAPAHDTVYPTIATAIVAVTYFAATQNGRRSTVAYFFVGAGIGLGMMFSLCFLPVATLCFMLTAIHNRRRWQRTAGTTATALAGWALIVVGVDLLGYRVWDSWMVNLVKNHEFNTHSGCTPWKWMAVDLLEFVASLGIPFAVLLVLRSREHKRTGKIDALLAAWVLLIGTLDLSCANLGEVSRLWLFLMPLGALLALEWIDFSRDAAWRLAVPLLLAIQAINCVLVDRELVLWWPVMPKQIEQRYTDETGEIWTEYRRLSDSELIRRWNGNQ